MLNLSQPALVTAVNVRAYGAVCDGITDDAARLQAAIDAQWLAGGGTVYVPNGTCLVSAAVIMKSGVSILGGGSASILKAAGAGAPVFKANTNDALVNVTIHGIRFVGTNADYSAGESASGVQVMNNGASGLLVSACSFDGFCYGVHVRPGAPDITMRDCQGVRLSGSLFKSINGVRHRVVDCTNNGVRTGYGDGIRTRVAFWLTDAGDGSDAGYYNQLRGCISSYTYNEGIIVRTAYSEVVGCTADNADDGASGSYAIVVEPTSGTSNLGLFGLGAGCYVKILGCTARASNGGIRVSLDPANVNGSPQTVMVHDCLVSDITGTSQKGIAIGYSGAAKTNRVSVQGNVVYNVTGATNADAIFLFNVVGGSVLGNTVQGCTRNGIHLEASADATKQTCGVAIHSNTVLSPGANGIYVWGRVAGALKHCVVHSNVIIFLDGASGSGVQVDSTTADAVEETAFTCNVVLGLSSTNGYAIRVRGKNLAAAGNVGIGIVNRRVIETNGSTTWFETAVLNDVNGRKVGRGTTWNTSSAQQDNVGDVIENTAPATGGYMGWVCTAAGTPGTWKPYGLIA